MTIEALEPKKQTPLQNDAVSGTLAHDAYNSNALKGTTGGEAGSARTTAVSNGQFDFGDVGALYGLPPATPAETTSPATPSETTSPTTTAPDATPVEHPGSTSQPQNESDLGLTSVNAHGIAQDGVGDCFFESALASVANSPNGEAAINNMIKANPDGSYTVTFPGDPTHPVTVDQSDLKAETGSDIADNAPWANIMETAFLKYDDSASFSQGLYKWQDEDVAWLGPVKFGDTALHLLTGQSVAVDSLAPFSANSELTAGSVSDSDVANSLTQAFKNGDAVTASTGWSVNDPGPLEGSHVYSVLSYDPQSGNVVVRNPWGDNSSNATLNQPSGTVDGITNLGDGKSEMSLDTFTHVFSDLNISGINPLENDAENIANDQSIALRAVGQTASDVWRGNFSAAGTDLSNLASDSLQVFSVQAYSAEDFVEHQVRDGFVDIEQSVVPVVNDAYLDISSVFHSLF